MREAKHDLSKAGFQVERLVFFTDGVFAIAITLLVIEIKVPESGPDSELTDHALLAYLREYVFKFIGFVFSFVIIAHFWSVHHRIFGYVKKYTTMLFWINLLYLFSVVIMPFTSGLLGQFSTEMEMKLPYTMYVANLCLAGFANSILWVYVSKPEREMLTRKIPKSRIKLGVYRSLIIPLVFLISLPISFVWPVLSRFIPLCIPFVLHYGMKGLERLADLQEVQPAPDAEPIMEEEAGEEEHH